VLAGSLPPGAPEDTYARLTRQLHELGVCVALDSSGPSLVLGCAAGPDLVKPNEVEARQLLGADHSVDWTARIGELLALGPKRVLLTLGAGGALWASAQGVWQAPAPAITEVSAVGAGDAALAGALYGLQGGLAENECLRWAVAAGSAKAGCDGTAMPTQDEIAASYAQLAVQQVTR
jgi:fructose-1-phosphate kinase PfkB-like protein